MQWAKRLLISLIFAGLAAIAVASAELAEAKSEFHFALLGDRTGEAQTGVYEEAWREAAAEKPAFVLTVGDSIQGGDDKQLALEWQQMSEILKPYSRLKLFLAPGNHDIWDDASKAAYVQFSHRPPHYSFDWQQAHFTVVDDSGADELNAEETRFLEADLRAHQNQRIKFVISHRPFWLLPVALGDSKFAFQNLALKYGVKYVIAGHIHQMLRFKLGDVNYLSMASSGGHLRNDKTYEHGWFFQHTSVSVEGDEAKFRIEELQMPFGQGRVTTADDWSAAGLMSRSQE